MATLSAAMVALLTANWAGAGAAPTFGALIDYQKELEDMEEQVIVRLPIYDDADPINDLLSNFKYIIQLRVKTTVSEDRLKILTDETIRIINNYAITGITRQFAKRGENTSDRKRQVFSYDVWANLEEHASTGGTAYASPGTGDVNFPANVTNRVDDKGFYTGAGDDVRIYHDGTNTYIDNETGELRVRQQAASDFIFSIKESLIIRDTDDAGTALFNLDSAGRTCKIGSATDAITTTFYDAADTITVANIADLLMFGSANAAWVPCLLFGGAPRADWETTYDNFLYNIGANALDISYTLPLPTTKGSLKLYVAGTRVGLKDADVDDFVTTVYVYGNTGTTITSLNAEANDLKTIDVHEDTFGAVDASSYEQVFVWIKTVQAGAAQLDINSVLLKCYYAA